jgi:NitT/TauT family transport system permease protein
MSGAVTWARPGGLRAAAGSLAERVLEFLPAAVVLAGGLVLWEFLIVTFNVKQFILPRPSGIGNALVTYWSDATFPLAASAAQTIREALGGLVIGTLAGLVVAFGSARWVTARDLVLPLAVAANAIPIIALAPLVNAWFGLLSPVSKMIMAAILVFFPVMANVTRGLTQVEPSAIELMRSYAASDWTILRKVRIPNALPFFFTAMKIATTLSLIGAIVGEYFGGQTQVLGHLIIQTTSALRYEITWAAILLGALAGIAFYLVTVVVERLVIPWSTAVRNEG